MIATPLSCTDRSFIHVQIDCDGRIDVGICYSPECQSSASEYPFLPKLSLRRLLTKHSLPAKQKKHASKAVDPPIKPDPLGNGIIGGAAGGVVKGAIGGGASAAASGCCNWCCARSRFGNRNGSRNSSGQKCRAFRYTQRKRGDVGRIADRSYVWLCPRFWLWTQPV